MRNFIIQKFLFMALAGLLLICPRSSWAQDYSFEATVNAAKVNLGSALQLTLTINGIQSASGQIQLPPIDGFEVKYVGPSTRISILNGQYHSAVGYIYTLFPTRVGKFEIPSLSVVLEGKTYSSQPINIEVIDSPQGQAPAPSSTASGQQAPTAGTGTLEDRIFLTINTPKTEAYLGEKIPVTIQLFINGLTVRDLAYPQLEQNGFVMDNFLEPQQYQQVVGGVRYTVVDFKTYIYPARVGDLSLGPAKINFNLLYESAARRQIPSTGAGSMFDDDFFNNLFQGYETRPVSLSSSDATLKSLPLPEDGKPQDFSGAVGQFDFEVTASPLEVHVGDPVTLRMKISGDGNLKSFSFPPLALGNSFKLYDPQVKEEGGNKILEQIVIPRSIEVKEVPAINFSFFDPQARAYRTISRGPFPLKMTESEQKQDFKMVGLSSLPEPGIVPETIGRDIIFIKENPGQTGPQGISLYQKPFFGILIALTLFIWGGLVIIYRRTHRLKTDVVYARRLQAPRKAKAGLAQARKFLTEGKQKEFYDVIFKTLQEYLGDKFHLASGAVTFTEVSRILKGKKVKDEVIEDIRIIFEECDRVRYAAAAPDQNKMQDHYSRLENVIDSLERSGS